MLIPPEIRGHHQFVGAVRGFSQKNLPAKIQGLFAVRLAEGVEVGTPQRFHAVNVAVHARVEPLFARDAGRQRRVEDNLIEHGMIGVDSEFFLRAGEHRGTGNLRPGARKRGNADVVYGRVLDQVPALIIGRGSRIGKHQGHGFGEIQSASAADADDPPRRMPGNLLDLRGQVVDIAGLGFVIDVDPDDQVPGLHRHPFPQGPAGENVVDQKDHEGSAFLPLGGQDVCQLIKAAAAEDDLGNDFEITKHGQPFLPG